MTIRRHGNRSRSSYQRLTLEFQNGEDGEACEAAETEQQTALADLQEAVFANGDSGERKRCDTQTSSNSEDWRNKTAQDLLVDLLDPVSYTV